MQFVLSSLLVAITSFTWCWFVHRRESQRRRRYGQWRAGHMPSHRPGIHRGTQLTLRAILTLTTVVALLVAYLSNHSYVGSFLAGLGCVAAGVILGLDHDRYRLGSLRGKPLGAAAGGLAGAFVFVCFLAIVQVMVLRVLPGAWYWTLLSQQFVLWTCLGVLGGAVIGLWRAGAPYRRRPKRHQLRPEASEIGEGSGCPWTMAHKITPHGIRKTQSPLFDLFPALAASLLIHLAIVVLQPGTLDLGVSAEASGRHAETNELRIVATLMSHRGIDDAQLASFDAKLDFAEDTRSPVDEEDLVDRESDRESQDQKVVPSDSAVDSETSPAIVAGTDQELPGIDSDNTLTIPLNGHNVSLVTKNWRQTIRDVSQLNLFVDGQRIRIEADTTDIMQGMELPMTRLSVEFDSRVSVPFDSRRMHTFVDFTRGISGSSPAAGELRLELRAPPAPIRAATPRPLDDATEAGRQQTGGAAKRLLLSGSCPVRLCDDDIWTRGDEKWQTVYKQWIIRFHSEDALRQFNADPNKYLPKFNGSDIVATVDYEKTVAGHHRFGLLFDALTTVAGSDGVYLFVNEENRDRFMMAPDRYVVRLDEPANP